MRRMCLFAGALALAGCSPSPFEKAKERAAFLERNHASADELCAAKRAVAEAAADERRAVEYQTASLDADAACAKAGQNDI